MIREWAEVPFVLSRRAERKDIRSYRYLAVRLCRQRKELFEDRTMARHFAVVSNRWDMEGGALLEWQRSKAGTIEQVHHILVSELAAGVPPSAKHEASATSFRLQVITHNLLELLKKIALPEQYAHVNPKRLRFSVFTVMGRLVSHAGRMLLVLRRAYWRRLLSRHGFTLHKTNSRCHQKASFSYCYFLISDKHQKTCLSCLGNHALPKNQRVTVAMRHIDKLPNTNYHKAQVAYYQDNPGNVAL